MDKYVKAVLDDAKMLVDNDFDVVFIVDGFVGAGKSVFTQQCAAYCDPDFEISQIAFTADEFIDNVVNARKKSAVIFDEAMSGMSAREAMVTMNRTLIKLMAEIRQKNLFVFIVLPAIHDLDRNIAIHRSLGLFHVYTHREGDKIRRGRVMFFNKSRKKSIYIQGKKFYSYSGAKANFVASFPGTYAVDETAYRQKKYDALKLRDIHKKKTKGEALLVAVMKKYMEEKDLSQHKMSDHAREEFGIIISQTSIGSLIAD